MSFPSKNILVLGASGMLGSALFSVLPKVSQNYTTFGTTRGYSPTPVLKSGMNLVKIENIFDADALLAIMKHNDIDVVINAIGLIKQIGAELTQSDFVRINSWLPHYLMELCDEVGARFLEISTDCVFTGQKGDYSEDDNPDARLVLIADRRRKGLQQGSIFGLPNCLPWRNHRKTHFAQSRSKWIVSCLRKSN